MSEEFRFRGPFEKQHSKRSQAPLKSASQHLYLIHWSLPRKSSWKKSVLLTWQVLELLLNTLNADDKYHVLNKNNLTIPVQMQFSQKQKHFLRFCPYFWNINSILNILKKKMILDFVFRKLRTRKTYSDNCIKSAVSEDSSTSHMVNLSKHYWNLHHSTFIKFIDHCQVNWIGKSLSYWKAESCDCLLTHWLQMTSILFLIKTI